MFTFCTVHVHCLRAAFWLAVSPGLDISSEAPPMISRGGNGVPPRSPAVPIVRCGDERSRGPVSTLACASSTIRFVYKFRKRKNVAGTGSDRIRQKGHKNAHICIRHTQKLAKDGAEAFCDVFTVCRCAYCTTVLHFSTVFTFFKLCVNFSTSLPYGHCRRSSLLAPSAFDSDLEIPLLAANISSERRSPLRYPDSAANPTQSRDWHRRHCSRCCF